MKKKATYKDSGVDIAKADFFVDSVKAMFKNKKSLSPAAFGSIYPLGKIFRRYKEPALVSSTDGVGTKLILARDLNIHKPMGVDLVAMNVNDIICLGARPLFFLDYIACGRVDSRILLEVAEGIKQGLNEAGCALLGGETAEMPGLYKPGEYDLAGFCVGVVDYRKAITGKGIREGDLLIGISSSGLHSNGFSLVRKVLSSSDIKRHSSALIEATRIYVKPLLSALSLPGARIKGVAHVTGGSFFKKVSKIAPKGLGFTININSWEVPEIFRLIQKKGNVSLREMYTVFNMGIGMVVVAAKKDADVLLKHFNRGFSSYIIGEAVKSNKKLRLI